MCVNLSPISWSCHRNQSTQMVKKAYLSSKIIATVSKSDLIFYNFGRLWLFILICGYLRLFNLYSHLYKLVIFDYKSELIYLSVSHR